MMSTSAAPSPGTPFVVPLYSAQSWQLPTRLAITASFNCFSFASMHHTSAAWRFTNSAYRDLQDRPVQGRPPEPADIGRSSPIDRAIPGKTTRRWLDGECGADGGIPSALGRRNRRARDQM